jgi:hypothetical protein
MNRHYLELVEEARQKKLILVDDCKQELSKLYLRAYKDINNKVFTKDSNIWAMQYRDELKKRTKELNPILYETVKNYAEKSADIGVYPEWALFSKILGDKDHEILNTLTRIPEEVVRELLNGDMYKDNQGLNKRIWRFQKENEQKIDYIIQRGLIEKKSTFELAKDLEMYVNPKAKKTFEWKKVYPNAGNKTIDFNAYRLASTSITHAYQMATIRAAQANPFSEGVKWHSVLSQRTCQLCKERHGKIFKAEDVPLDHPLGLCTTYSVITKSLKEISEELKKEVYNIDKPTDKGYNRTEEIVERSAKSEIRVFSDSQQVNKYCYNSEEYKNWEKGITLENKDSIEAYTSNKYKDINKYNRKIEEWAPEGKYGSIIAKAEEFMKTAPSVVQQEGETLFAFKKRRDAVIPPLYREAVNSKKLAVKHNEQLDDVIQKYELQDNIRCYRAVKIDALPKFDKLEDLIGKTYTDKSYMSTTPTLDSRFITSDMEYIFQITVPHGKGNGAYLENFTHVKNEHEFLLPRNCKFSIKGVRKEGKRNFIEMEMLP